MRRIPVIKQPKNQLSMRKLFVSIFGVTVAGGGIFFLLFLLPSVLSSSYEVDTSTSSNQVALPPPVVHLDTPDPLKALYMTACVAGTPSWRKNLKELIETTELNAVVIDIKDATGQVSFQQGANCFVSDMEAFIKELHDSHIYVIGRISVFQDPSYTKLHPELAVKSKSTGGVWKDYKGLSFIDVGARPYWDYIIDLSRKSYALGFDEINFDYVRYPSDGNMKDTNFTYTVGTSTKAEMLESFFEYLSNNLEDVGLKMSADLFGMTTTVTADMGIGQVLENALPYFDYIAPMVYPSHYPKTWSGFANPAEHPYEVIKIAMGSAVKREEAWRVSNGLATSTPSKMRPWLQDFNLGTTYGPDKVRAQIKATYDVGINSWMMWNAANRYTREALLTED